MTGSSSVTTDILVDCREARVEGPEAFWWLKSSPSKSHASSDTDVLLPGRAWARPALTSFSNIGDGAWLRWGNEAFCAIAVVDKGRLDAGIQSSELSDSALEVVPSPPDSSASPSSSSLNGDKFIRPSVSVVFPS